MVATRTDLRISFVELPTWTVRVTSPGGVPSHVRVSGQPLVVGTDAAADIQLADPKVSRRHAELRRLPDGQLQVQDLGSKNGVWVERVLVQLATIAHAQTVTIGESRLVVEGGPVFERVELADGVRFGDAVGASLPMRALFAKLEQAAMSDETIVLLGESGTGKEVLARSIHQASSRQRGPFVVFDCSTVAASLAESELFGHVRGAFTGAHQSHMGVFEQAEGGTLFIDELGELPSELQPKLLRALEARHVRRVGGTEWTKVNVRVIAATHRDLHAQVRAGAFRQDLYYRLAVLEMSIPPLRERREDIPLLVETFLQQQAPPRSLRDLPHNALELLQSYEWPGNLRELRNIVSRMLLFRDAQVMPASAQVVPAARVSPYSGAAQAAEVVGLPLREAREMVVEQFERAYVEAKLSLSGGNVSRAAEAMGVSRQFLYRLLDRYRIERG